MALKVAISSVRRGGLGAVRDAVRPVIQILGYEPVRFEEQTAQPVPSRAICVDMIKRSDLYLLLLGGEYGDPMPDTSLAPTEEEWTIARNEGKPIVAFRQTGVTPEPRQTAFISEVEAYATGIFRDTFKDTGELLGKLREALAAGAATIQPMRPRRLGAPVAIPWRPEDRSFGYVGGIVLETHVVPVDQVDRLGAAGFADISRRLARAGREHGLFSEGDPLVFAITEEQVAAQRDAASPLPEAGVSISADRAMTVWDALPTQAFGTVYDEAEIANRIARDLRLAVALDLLAGEEVTIAIGINRFDMLGQITGPNSMAFPFMGSGAGAARLESLEAYTTAGLVRTADELGRELAARLTLHLQRR
jgi:hypothetical protein